MECPIGKCMWKKEFSIAKCGNGKEYPYCVAWEYASKGAYWNDSIKHYVVPREKLAKGSKRLNLKTKRLNLRKD